MKKEFISLIDQAIVSGSSFLTAVILARTISKAEFGIFNLGITVILFTKIIQDSLISSPYTVYSQDLTGIEKAAYTGSTLIHQVILSLLLVIVFIAIQYTSIFEAGFKDLSRVFGILAPAITTILLFEYIRRLCYAWLRVGNALLIDFCVAILQIIIIIIFLATNILSVRNAFLAIACANGIIALGWLKFKFKLINPSFSRSRNDFQKNIAYGKWLFWSGLSYSMSTLLYPWILAYYHNNAAVGTFAACRGAISIAIPFLDGIQNTLGPKISNLFTNKGIQEMRVYIKKITLVIFSIMILFCIVMFLFGGRIVELMYGSRYSGNDQIVWILVLGQFASSIAFPINYGLLAMRRPDAHLKTSLLNVIIMLTFGIYLVYRLGPLGVAVAILIGNIMTSLFRFLYYKKQFNTVLASSEQL